MRSLTEIKDELKQFEQEITKLNAEKELYIKQLKELTGVGTAEKALKVVNEWKEKLQELDDRLNKILGALNELLGDEI